MIVCAAIKSNNIIICGARHWDKVMRQVVSELHYDDAYWFQGFIDQMGKFYSREDAMIHAKACGQHIDWKRNSAANELYSEGLY